MRRLTPLLLAVAILVSGCTSGSDDPKPTATATGDDRSVTLAALRLDWPKAQGKLVVAKPPATPDGFDDATYARMAKVLTKWAKVAAVDDSVWHSNDPLAAITKALPAKACRTPSPSRARASSRPISGVANVFGDDVTVVGTPMITTAWKVTVDKDETDKPYVLLELQTRAAYEVRFKNGATRVIGVLRVHGLSAYQDTKDDFGVGGGWQEFGASDCALALDDALVPDSDREEGLADLATFLRVGKGNKLEMPKLSAPERVDDEYLKRCRDGQSV